MPTDSNGNYTLPAGYLAVTGQTVLASQHNPPLEDLGTSMTARLPRNGSAGMLADFNHGGYKAVNMAQGTDPTDGVTLAQMNAAIASIATIPTGVILPMTGAAVPPGWIVANGQSLSRATYPTFWAYAQTSGNIAATEGAKTIGQYGPGDGSTTFTVPNLYADGGHFIRPMGSGRTIGSVQADEIKSHAHGGSTAPAGAHSHLYDKPNNTGGGSAAGSNHPVTSVTLGQSTSGASDHTHAVTVDPAGGPETRPRNIAYPVLIKT